VILNFKIIFKSIEPGKWTLSVTEITAELKFSYIMWIPISSFSLFPHQCNFCPQAAVFQGEHTTMKDNLRKRLISVSQNHKPWFSEKEDKSDSFRTKVGKIRWSQFEMWLKKKKKRSHNKNIRFLSQKKGKWI